MKRRLVLLIPALLIMQLSMACLFRGPDHEHGWEEGHGHDHEGHDHEGHDHEH